jgi:hypothetical protein
MLYADFEARQQLAREHRDELAREMRLARGPRTDAAPPAAARHPLRRFRAQIRPLARLRAWRGQLPQEA